MYLQYWGLHESPFLRGPETRWFFEGPGQEEARARLLYVLEHRRPLAVLEAGMGCGKTTLLNHVAEHAAANGLRVFDLNLQGMEVNEFWSALAHRLGLHVAEDEPVFRVWRRVCEALAADQYVGRHALLIADDADEAAPATISALSRLVSLDVSAGVRLTTIVGCLPTGLDRLGDRMLEQAELLVELEALSLEETRAYLHGCVVRAGRTDPLFTNAAVLRLHELSDGVLRRLNRLADQALAAGFVQGQVCIDTQTVEGVFHELGAASFVRRIA